MANWSSPKPSETAAINPDRAAATDTRYAIGSISKQFTAAALLLLQEQGKLSLDDKVAQVLPEPDARR